MEGHLKVAPTGLHLPSIDRRVARQVVAAAIETGPLQECPVHALADLDPACDHHPRLAAMVGGELHLHCHVRAGREPRNFHPLEVVELLPDIEALSVEVRDGAAGRGGLVVLIASCVAF